MRAGCLSVCLCACRLFVCVFVRACVFYFCGTLRYVGHEPQIEMKFVRELAGDGLVSAEGLALSHTHTRTHTYARTHTVTHTRTPTPTPSYAVRTLYMHTHTHTYTPPTHPPTHPHTHTLYTDMFPDTTTHTGATHTRQRKVVSKAFDFEAVQKLYPIFIEETQVFASTHALVCVCVCVYIYIYIHICIITYL